MFEIYSIGDAAFLTQILNAVAAMTGTGDFRQLVAVGLVIGIILGMFQGLVNNTLYFGRLFIAMLIYLLAFGTSVSVTVEDAYTGSVRVVDNVPIGPAAVGAAMSNVGYGVTRLMEQAFSTPAMTGQGFADALQTLAGVRKATLSRASLGAANAPVSGTDVEGSLVNYVADCVLADVDTQRRTLDDILTAPDVTTALASSNVAFTTLYYEGGVPQTLRCDQAWARISAFLPAEFLPAVKDTLQARFGVANTADVESKLQNAVDALAGAGRDAQDYVLMSAALGWLEKGIVLTHENRLQWAAATSVQQAIAQRNAQWAAEQALFMNIVRPMMTFFEGFIYAVAPLMGFAVALGPMGISLTGKWLMFALWTQLWLPVLAVTNLYLMMAAGRDLDALSNVAQLEPFSFYGLMQLDLILQDWLATGGMLAAATPAIALMLIYGSAVTATHLAGRLRGSDHIDEKGLSPSVSSTAPALAISSGYQNTPYAGTVATGAESILPRFDLGTQASRETAVTEQALQQSSRQFLSSLGQTASMSAAHNRESFSQRALGFDYSASASETDKTLFSTGSSLSQQYAQTGLSANQMTGMLATGVGLAGGGRSGSAISGQLSGELRDQYQVSDQMAERVADDIATRVTSDTGFQSSLASSVSADAQQGLRSVFTQGLSTQDSAQLQQSAADVVQDSRSHQRAERLSQSAAASGSYGAAEVGQRLAGNPALAGQAYSAIDRLGLTGDHQRVSDWYSAMGVFANPEQARAAAAMHLLAGYAKPDRALSGEERLQARETAFSILGDAFQGPGGTGANPANGAGLHGAAGVFGSTRDQVLGAGLPDPRAQVAGLDGRLAENFLGNAALGGGDAVNRFHQDAQQRLMQSQAQREASLAEQRSDYWERQILGEANSHRSPAEATTDQLAGGIGNLLQRGIVQGDRAVAAFNGLLRGLQQGEGWSGAVAQARERYGDAIDGLASYQLQSLPENALTGTQEDFYRNQVDNGLLGNSAMGQALRFASPEQQALRERLVAEHGPDLGPAIAHQLTQAANSLDNSKLTEVMAYNRAEADAAEAQKKTESLAPGGLPGTAPAGLIHPNVSGGSAGAVLDVIARPESRGNYNALFGDAGQQQLRLTDMTLEQVQQVQQQLVAERGGSPVGRYQILDDTLEGLIDRMGLSGQERFSPALQDRMALVLAADAGLGAWQSGRLSDETFASRLSKIWAGLPADASGRSYHEGKAGNRALVGWESVVTGLGSARRGRD
ncbi:conjugal transfer protein TraG N-terminal domain-containing protein [Thiorhodovibrio frisius]|uniref:Muramidase (Phage lambda lysozyme) n=1 Tax=Thiorhodovibrio frisius TaxID=631362 RepID=H8YW32_9GAMM|nr:conjugal transfer protein TraG N-terminal domain-containing protein [Thiorhodovibrio frisius]EIC23823.1 muramidase (phage lambda lysozyme) [Thiorhodovibrio frisius]WPL22993.1 conjugal transfer mating pair stabilization protein TraG [Thiorhodovibrio frisius]